MGLFKAFYRSSSMDQGYANSIPLVQNHQDGCRKLKRSESNNGPARLNGPRESDRLKKGVPGQIQTIENKRIPIRGPIHFDCPVPRIPGPDEV